MTIGIPSETFPGERRVAMTPMDIPRLLKTGADVLVQAGAGESAGFPDSEYAERGARMAQSRHEVFQGADIVLQVRCLGANPENGPADLDMAREGQIVIGHGDPLSAPEAARAYAAKGAAHFSMELVPRITRAQAVDVLSSQATVAGYKAVLIAAEQHPRMFPMLNTAAGTLAAAHVLVVGAGVAGLQAIATARRLGAIVSAYDVRPAVKEQVLSLGAKFVELELEAGQAEGESGYAREMGEEFYAKQRELMGRVVAASDAVITTAAVPGQKAPVLVTAEMVGAMRRGSVIVDLAAERGGNCELTVPGQTVESGGVTVIGPLNLPSTAPHDASQMYARNLSTFLALFVKQGQADLDVEDEVVQDTLVTRGGEVVHPRVRELLGLQGASPERNQD